MARFVLAGRFAGGDRQQLLSAPCSAPLGTCFAGNTTAVWGPNPAPPRDGAGCPKALRRATRGWWAPTCQILRVDDVALVGALGSSRRLVGRAGGRRQGLPMDWFSGGFWPRPFVATDGPGGDRGIAGQSPQISRWPPSSSRLFSPSSAPQSHPCTQPPSPLRCPPLADGRLLCLVGWSIGADLRAEIVPLYDPARRLPKIAPPPSRSIARSARFGPWPLPALSSWAQPTLSTAYLATSPPAALIRGIIPAASSHVDLTFRHGHGGQEWRGSIFLVLLVVPRLGNRGAVTGKFDRATKSPPSRMLPLRSPRIVSFTYPSVNRASLVFFWQDNQAGPRAPLPKRARPDTKTCIDVDRRHITNCEPTEGRKAPEDGRTPICMAATRKDGRGRIFAGTVAHKCEPIGHTTLRPTAKQPIPRLCD